MRKKFLRDTRWTTVTVILATVAVISACEQSEPAPDTRLPVVETIEIGAAELGGLRKLPARIEASERAELSFRVDGTLQQLLVAEGSDVEKNQVLAVLDQNDFKTALADREAAHRRASADYERAQQLVEYGNISRRDFDLIESRFKRTRAAEGLARANLEYTVLAAPFAGLLAQRHVENHEEVDRGQVIFSLRSVNQVDVKFDVPESMIILLTNDPSDPDVDPVRVTAQFEANAGVDYPLVFKEIATRADPRKKTFEATFLMDTPENFNVLPGMTADVTINMPSLRGAIFTVPSRAVLGDIYMDPVVWILDRETMTVSMKAVQVGRLTGSSIEVLDGLQPGDLVVTSPSNFLLQGQKVLLATDSGLEEAEAEAAESS